MTYSGFLLDISNKIKRTVNLKIESGKYFFQKQFVVNSKLRVLKKWLNLKNFTWLKRYRGHDQQDFSAEWLYRWLKKKIYF